MDSSNIWRTTDFLGGSAQINLLRGKVQVRRKEEVCYIGRAHAKIQLTYWTPWTAHRKNMLLEEASKIKIYVPSCDSSPNQVKIKEHDLNLLCLSAELDL